MTVTFLNRNENGPRLRDINGIFVPVSSITFDRSPNRLTLILACSAVQCLAAPCTLHSDSLLISLLISLLLPELAEVALLQSPFSPSDDSQESQLLLPLQSTTHTSSNYQYWKAVLRWKQWDLCRKPLYTLAVLLVVGHRQPPHTAAALPSRCKRCSCRGGESVCCGRCSARSGELY